MRFASCHPGAAPEASAAMQRLLDLPEHRWLAAARRQATVVIFGLARLPLGSLTNSAS